MEKYATYRVYKHKTTGEIKRVSPEEMTDFEKIASNEWIELDKDPETDGQ
tara:strand:- start:131 stop:280 length:150 start_codon:yes stop_codon:yes gene_type:complete